MANRLNRLIPAAIAIVMLPAGAAVAQMADRAPDAPVDCSAPAPALPAELAGWPRRTLLTAAADPATIDAAALAPGQAVDAELIPTATLHYALRPEKPGGTVSFGGMFALTIAKPGTYRIAIGSGAWIDLIADGKAIGSAGHGHGPDCSGIRKMVDFALTPGRYVLQIAANGSPSLPILVARLP